jgi:hypothetical protein
MMVTVKQLVELRLAGEIEVLRKNLPHHGGKPATNRLSHGTALILMEVTVLFAWLLRGSFQNSQCFIQE